MSHRLPPADRDDFKIAIICALRLEYDALTALESVFENIGVTNWKSGYHIWNIELLKDCWNKPYDNYDSLKSYVSLML